jgi:hypothetical protein
MSFRRADAWPPPGAVYALMRAPRKSAFPVTSRHLRSPLTLATAKHPG